MFGRQFDHEGAPGKRGPFFGHRLFGKHVVGACNWSAAHSRKGEDMDLLKWIVKPHPIEEERRGAQKRKLEPTPEWLANAVARKRDLLKRAPGTTDEFKKVLEEMKAEEVLEKLGTELTDEYVHDFRNWVMGIGKRSDYVKAGVPLDSVGQGKPLSRGKDVIKFADAITSRVMRYYTELAEMKMRGPAVGKGGRPATLDDLWMYFKYVVRNEPMNAEDFSLYLYGDKDERNPRNVDASLVGNQEGIRDELANAPSLEKKKRKTLLERRPADAQSRGKFDAPRDAGYVPKEPDEDEEALIRELEEQEKKEREQEQERRKKEEEERKRREKEEQERRKKEEEERKRKEKEEQERKRKEREEPPQKTPLQELDERLALLKSALEHEFGEHAQMLLREDAGWTEAEDARLKRAALKGEEKFQEELFDVMKEKLRNEMRGVLKLEEKELEARHGRIMGGGVGSVLWLLANEMGRVIHQQALEAAQSDMEVDNAAALAQADKELKERKEKEQSERKAKSASEREAMRPLLEAIRADVHKEYAHVLKEVKKSGDTQREIALLEARLEKKIGLMAIRMAERIAPREQGLKDHGDEVKRQEQLLREDPEIKAEIEQIKEMRKSIK
jgi:hypothetical protein